MPSLTSTVTRETSKLTLHVCGVRSCLPSRDGVVCAVCEQWATWDGIRKFEAEKHDYLQGQIGLGPKLFVCACLVFACALLCC